MRDRVRELMDKLPENMDGALISGGKVLKYFTGVNSEVLLVSKKKSYLFTYENQLSHGNQERSFEVVPIICLSKQIKNFVKYLGLKLIGVDSEKITLSQCIKYEAFFGGAKIVRDNRISFIIKDIRRKKDAEEVEFIATAQRFAEKAFDDILNFIKPGVTEREIAARLSYIMYISGSEGDSFAPLVSTGTNTAQIHSIPSNKPVKEGDFVMMDYGATYNGYCSDMTRTVAVGRADEEMQRIYSIVLQAQNTAISAITPGIRCKDIDAVARDYFANQGYSDYFPHTLGHCVGLDLHEMPFLSPNSMINRCHAGDVTTVEPGLYIEGKFGVRIEDMIFIGENKNINLTKADKKLIIV